MAENVILLQRPGPVHWQRQVAACQPYLDEHHYVLVGKAETAADAFQLAFDGLAKIIVAAWPDAEDWRLGRLMDEIDGRFEVCRPGPNGADRLGVDTSGVIAFLHDRGRPIGDIASFLRVAPERVRRAISRYGVRRRR